MAQLTNWYLKKDAGFSGEGAKNVNLYLVNSATGLTEGDIPKILKQIKDIDKYRENGIN